MTPRLRDDWKEIADAYKSGLSLFDLHKEFGVGVSHASRKLREMGVQMHGQGYKREIEWRKLIPTGGWKAGRLLTIPIRLLREMGFNPENEIRARWKIVSPTMLSLELKQVK